MSSDLQRASRRDIPRLAELWGHAFPGERTIEQRIRQLEAGGVYGGIEDSWYLTRHDRLAGALRLYSLQEYLHGTPLPMMGVAAVAVASDARRQGIGADMCRQALRLGRSRGDVVSVLYPFRPEFYHRLGWGLAGSLHSFRFPPAALPAPSAPTHVRLADAGARAGVEQCYARVAAGAHGLIERSARVWDQQLGAGERYLFVLPADGRLAGYLLVRYHAPRTPARRALVVHELVAEDDVAYRELLGWLALQADQWPLVRYDALPEERFDLLLREPRPPQFRPARTLWFPVAQRIRGPMLRILDVPAALQARSTWPDTAPVSFTLRVRDPELPENDGPWAVRFAGGKVTCGAAELAGEPDLEVPAPELAMLYAGELGVGDAVRAGRARAACGTAQLLAVDALMRPRRTFRLLDEF